MRSAVAVARSGVVPSSAPTDSRHNRAGLRPMGVAGRTLVPTRTHATRDDAIHLAATLALVVHAADRLAVMAEALTAGHLAGPRPTPPCWVPFLHASFYRRAACSPALRGATGTAQSVWGGPPSGHRVSRTRCTTAALRGWRATRPASPRRRSPAPVGRCAGPATRWRSGGSGCASPGASSSGTPFAGSRGTAVSHDPPQPPAALGELGLRVGGHPHGAALTVNGSDSTLTLPRPSK